MNSVLKYLQFETCAKFTLRQVFATKYDQVYSFKVIKLVGKVFWVVQSGMPPKGVNGWMQFGNRYSKQKQLHYR